jgi:hypothetical protein
VNGVPKVIIKAVDYIDKKGLEVEGIFRVPGSTQQIEDFKEQFDRGEFVNCRVSRL